MNIKTRLKKIESELQLDSEFCRCDKQIVIKVEPRSETEESIAPKLCETCGKIEEQRRFTFNLTGGIRLPETEIILPPYRVIEPGDEYREEQNR